MQKTPQTLSTATDVSRKINQNANSFSSCLIGVQCDLVQSVSVQQNGTKFVVQAASHA